MRLFNRFPLSFPQTGHNGQQQQASSSARQSGQEKRKWMWNWNWSESVTGQNNLFTAFSISNHIWQCDPNQVVGLDFNGLTELY